MPSCCCKGKVVHVHFEHVFDEVEPSEGVLARPVTWPHVIRTTRHQAREMGEGIVLQKERLTC